MKNFIHNNNQDSLRFCYRDTRINQTRVSHAPLFYETVYKDRFTKNLEEKTDVKLSADAVRDKCFQLLGFLEQYQMLPSNEEGLDDFVNQLELADFDSDNLDAFYETFLDGTEQETSEQESETVDEEAKRKKRKEMVKTFREKLTEQIRDLLSYSDVRKKFEEDLAQEAESYKIARPRMRKIAKMQAIERGASSRMVQTYLSSKKQHGHLVQSHKGGIKKLQQVKQKAKQQESDEKLTAENEEKGWLVAQELLQYKNQIKERGFAMTPSRQELFDRIVEHAMSGKRVFLVGSTGTGKTELAFYALDEISGGYEVIPWHEGTTPRDIFGYRELYTDEHGNTVSGPKPGPYARASKSRKAVLHEELTTGSTKTMMNLKYLMAKKPGEISQLPGFNGEGFEIPLEMFTGNLMDEKTKSRTDMDPAMLRVMTGLKVGYMPESEMTKIILAQLMEESGVLKLSKEEIKLIQKLSRAAELMQMFHDRQFDQLKSLPAPQRTILANAFGGSADDLSDAKLDKNFLDPGTLFSLFSDFDFSEAKGMTLSQHLSVRLTEFLQDPKNENAPEEKKLALAILKVCGVVNNASSIEQASVNNLESERHYTLPSELGLLEGRMLDTSDPFAQGRGPDSGAPTPPRNPESETGLSPERAKEILGNHFQGIEEINNVLAIDGFQIADTEPTPINATEEELNKWKEWAESKTRNGKTPILMYEIKKVKDKEGMLHDFTPAFIAEWLGNTKNENFKGKGTYFADYITDETRTASGNGEWSYIFSDGVKGSNNENTDICDGTESGQVQYLKKELRSGRMAEAPSLYKAMVLHCAMTGETLLNNIWVRTETKDRDDDRVHAHFVGFDFCLNASHAGNACAFLFASRSCSSPEFS